jgi:hypothetical protein
LAIVLPLAQGVKAADQHVPESSINYSVPPTPVPDLDKDHHRDLFEQDRMTILPKVESVGPDGKEVPEQWWLLIPPANPEAPYRLWARTGDVFDRARDCDDYKYNMVAALGGEPYRKTAPDFDTRLTAWINARCVSSKDNQMLFAAPPIPTVINVYIHQ